MAPALRSFADSSVTNSACDVTTDALESKTSIALRKKSEAKSAMLESHACARARAESPSPFAHVPLFLSLHARLQTWYGEGWDGQMGRARVGGGGVERWK